MIRVLQKKSISYHFTGLPHGNGTVFWGTCHDWCPLYGKGIKTSKVCVPPCLHVCASLCLLVLHTGVLSPLCFQYTIPYSLCGQANGYLERSIVVCFLLLVFFTFSCGIPGLIVYCKIGHSDGWISKMTTTRKQRHVDVPIINSLP